MALKTDNFHYPRIGPANIKVGGINSVHAAFLEETTATVAAIERYGKQ